MFDVDEALVAEHIGDPFERKQVMQALQAVINDIASHDDAAVLLEHGDALLLVGDDIITTALAMVGHPVALALQLGL